METVSTEAAVHTVPETEKNDLFWELQECGSLFSFSEKIHIKSESKIYEERRKITYGYFTNKEELRCVKKRNI